MKVSVDVDSTKVVAALNALIQSGGNLRPAFGQIGEYLILSTKERFRDGVGPDGTPWAPNTEATLLGFLGVYKGSYTKRGKLSKKGADRVTSKKPLIGETRALSTEIVANVANDGVEVGSPMEYAAVHQFGAAKGAFGRTRRGAPIPWGDIPARPFLGLSGEDETEIVAILNEHLARDTGITA